MSAKWRFYILAKLSNYLKYFLDKPTLVQLWVILLLLHMTWLANADVADSILEARHEIHIVFAQTNNIPLSNLSQMMSVARIKNDTVEAFLNRSQWNRFKVLGIPYKLVLPFKSAKNSRVQEGWKYPSERELRQMLYRLQTLYPEACRIYCIGKSVNNRPLWFARINSDTLTSKPSVMLTSTMHGNETGGMMLMVRFIEFLLSSRTTNTQVKLLTDSLDIWINPLANPDGFYYDTTDVYQATRFNANGVDLNRNFPDPVMGPHPDGNAYQPETQAMINLLHQYRFVLSANFHSGEEVVNYPWDSRSTLHPDDLWFRYVAKQYADSAIQFGTNGYFQTYVGNSTVAGITNGYAWYPVYGGRQDYVTYFCKGREFTIELDKNFITPENELEQLWQSNYRSLLTFLSSALQGIKGFVYDKITGSPLFAQIKILNHDIESSMVNTDSINGIFYRLLLPGKYFLQVFASGYDTTIIESNVLPNQYTQVNISLLPSDIKNYVHQPVIYPNPAQDRLFFKVNSHEKWRYILINREGKVLKEGLLDNSVLSVAYLTPGVYYLKLISQTKQYRYKFIKIN
ncbi:MAG: M14 family zinc carboxypeptidase [Bacteroidales bacterium]|nr:M14 family zinc carboxypeptidase [Bacteroidales bacterium]